MTLRVPSDAPTGGNIRQGLVYERASHVTLKSIANNSEIDVIWEKWEEALEPVRARLNAALSEYWEEGEIPRKADEGWLDLVTAAHAEWWTARITRQKEIDASITAKADQDYLYNKPSTDNARVRVASPFTVESWHRTGCWRWTKTRRASLSATPAFWVRTTPARPSRRR